MPTRHKPCRHVAVGYPHMILPLHTYLALKIQSNFGACLQHITLLRERTSVGRFALQFGRPYGAGCYTRPSSSRSVCKQTEFRLQQKNRFVVKFDRYKNFFGKSLSKLQNIALKAFNACLRTHAIFFFFQNLMVTNCD